MAPPNAISVLGSFEQGQLNHWYVSQSSTLASVAGESAGDDAGMDSANLLGLAKPITKSVAGQYDTASAYAGVLPTKRSVAAFTSTGQSFSDMHALGFAMAGVSYFTIMDQPGTVTMTLHLSGTLSSLTLGSKAAMSLVAIGSGVDEGLLNTLDQGSQGDDLDVLQAMQALPQINDRHAQVVSARHADGAGGTDTFDQDLAVSADGVAFACPESGAGQAYCGKYLYGFTLGLQAASTNNAHADFAHTLTVTGLQLPQGAALSFEPGAAIPTTTAVPEASTGAMTLVGLGMVAGCLARRRRQQH
ncbi:MAG: hypothetical protein HYX44_08315 [Aquabacterium sp.]|nr:hypothetical protein [Aquabacterium sp.]